jgi:outer membrane PBP1 activator LpoA protein
VAAIRAWRSERDAPRARALLTNYLRQHPRGALAEDALALLIEITAAQKDPAALTHAQRYLRAYPRGRFRSVAERVVAASEGASR